MAGRLLSLLASTMGLDESEVTEQSDSESIAAWDSTSRLMLASMLEYEYGVELSLSDMESLDSVRAVRAVLGTHGVRDA